MSRQYDEQPDLDLVSAYFAGLGLATERFPVAQTQTGKTSDFKVLRASELVAYCEVKSPNDPLLDTLLDEAPPMTIVGGLRDDPTFNRLARQLGKADEQFAAVNSDRSALNILAYVNHDSASHCGDMIELLTGYFHSEDGSMHPTLLHLSEGRLRESKRRIDAFLWFDGKSGRMQAAVINEADPDRKQRVCSLLKLDPAKIQKGVPS